ncbi:TPA: hypothetical protein ACX6RX_003195 [Photobacterium damselae]
MKFLSFIVIFISLPAASNELKSSYDQLNDAYLRCSNLERKADFHKFENSWFSTLNDQEQILILRKLSKKAFKQCVKPEAKNIAYELVQNVIETGNDKALVDYIKLMEQPNLSQETQLILDRLDENKLKNLSKNSLFKSPFNAFDAFNQINGKPFKAK